MKKETLRLLIIALVVLIAYNFAVFMIPCYKTTTFWISWGFSLLSFAVAGYAIYAGLIRKPDAKSRFYGFPIARIGVIYLVAQVAVGGVFMAIGHIVPWWLATVLFSIGLALAVIGLISAESVVDHIQVQDLQLKQKVSAMRGLQSQIRSIASQTESAAIKNLAEEFRYSDPVSCDATAELENELKAILDTMQQAVVDADFAAAEQLCGKAAGMLTERNRLCKLNK